MTRSVMWAVTVLLAISLLAGCNGLPLAGPLGQTPSGKAQIAEALAPSLARVEYTVQYDKGEAPEASGWAQRCPVCGRYHGTPAAALVHEERPLELPGFVLSPTSVVCPDIVIHPRFVKGIAVRYGDQLVPAHPAALARAQNAVFLQLDEPLRDVTPLAFDANAKPPYLAVTCQLLNGQWTTAVDPLGSAVAVTETRRRFGPAPPSCLITDERGTPVALSMADELPVDDSWKGSPNAWPTVTAEQTETLLAETENRADASLLRVALSFRSPKKLPGMMFHYRSSEEDEATERNVVGVLVDDTTVLVLADLKANVTARLERIVVHPKDADPIPATFVGTLTDYGAFLVKLASPLPNPARLSQAPVLNLRNTLLMAAQVTLQGENRVAYFNHGRIPAFDLGWRRHVYPEVPYAGGRVFLFTTNGDLVAIPLARRVKVSQDRWREHGPTLTATSYLTDVLAAPDEHFDLSNVPLSEEEENRLAWLGVELQDLDKELARINNVSDLTRDGEIGALVSYVYEDSPAAQAGVKPGDILLRLHIEGEPKPLEVRVEDYGFGRGQSFPWDRLDEVPEEYLNEIPMPWPSAESNLSRQLTEVGFGKSFTAEFFSGGQVVTKDFQVTQSPPHYNSARRFKSDALGLTIRDLTYEVRRYFQRSPDEGGVIVSKVEPGSKAAVSGIKPYEIVTHVNDHPVTDVAGFQRLIAGQDELRLTIKRMTKGRVVKIKMAAPASRPASSPEPTATEPSTAPAEPTTTEPADEPAPAEPEESPDEPAPEASAEED